MGDETKPSRREFLSIATWAIGGVIATMLAIPAVAYFISPAVQRGKKPEWIRLGPISKVELGTPTLFKMKIQRQTGWVMDEEELSVYVRTDNGRDFVGMSSICPHLGCRVRWIAEQERFFCPCHNGVFDKDGNVVSGPPPRPLSRYNLKIEGDQILIPGG